MTFCVAFVSSQLKWKEPTDDVISPNEINGLKKSSLIRLSKIATLDKALAIGLLGSVSHEIIQKINKNLKIIFELE